MRTRSRYKGRLCMPFIGRNVWITFSYMITMDLVWQLGASCLAGAQMKCALSFAPSSQYVHISVTFTISGTMLTTADMLAIVRYQQSNPTACGNSSLTLNSIAGGSPQRLRNLSADGATAAVSMTLAEISANAVVCIRYYPEDAWQRVGTAYFQVLRPIVSSFKKIASPIIFGNEKAQVILYGTALVMGLSRLRFRLSTQNCSGTDDIDSLGGVLGLSSSNNEGSSGLIEFVVTLKLEVSELVLCMASNMDPLSLVDNLSFQYIPRFASHFIGPNIIIPSIPTTYFVVGQNLYSSVSAQPYVKMDNACKGVSDSSDIIGGEGRMATYVNQTYLLVSFRIEPISDIITSVGIVSGGNGYEEGTLLPAGGDGSGFEATFVVDLLGSVGEALITSSGDGYTVDPILIPTYSTSSQCGPDLLSENCAMTGTVVSIVQKNGLTTGCFAETAYVVGVGGSGFGFRAAIISNNIGQIVGFTIENHGIGYIQPPRLVVNYTISASLGQCQCGSEILDGLPTQSSLLNAHIVGNMDACFAASIAWGASFQITDSGWRRRNNKRLCIKYGDEGTWSDIEKETVLEVLPTYTNATFQPNAASSYRAFSLTITGYGFEIAGEMQSKIKLSQDCSSDADKDDIGAIVGGEGRPCQTLNTLAEVQVCVIDFVLAVKFLTNVSLCRRVGSGSYRAISTQTLELEPVQFLSFFPYQTFSSTVSAITIIGNSFSLPSLLHIRLQICSHFVCYGGGTDANAGEPCEGLSDNVTCTAGAQCKIGDYGQNLSTANASVDAFDCAMPGGQASLPVSVEGCNSNNENCTFLVFRYTLVSMANVTAALLWSFAGSTFQTLPGKVVVNGSRLIDYGQIPAIVNSFSSFSFSLVGANIVDAGSASVKFKYLSSSTLKCTDGNNDDVESSATGGMGRTMTNLTGSQSFRTGTLTFQLILPEDFSVVINNFRADPKYAKVRLCWKVGNLHYREIGSGAVTTVSTSRILGFSPSDWWPSPVGHANVQATSTPVFASNEMITLTVIGRNLGLDSANQSVLKIRPIAMPFDVNETYSQNCVAVDTSPDTRSQSCQEFPASIDDPFGGSSNFCEIGSNIDTVLMQDELSANFLQSGIKAPSANPSLLGQTFYDDIEFAVLSFRRTLIRPKTRFMLCWSASILSVNASLNAASPWQPIGVFLQRIDTVTTYYVFSVNTFDIVGAFLIEVQPTTIVSNKPFTLNVKTSGLRCSDTEIKFKLAVGDTLQSTVGGPLGIGCAGGNYSDTQGAVAGTTSVFAICVPTSASDSTSISFNVPFSSSIVQYDTTLELCWAMAYGTTSYYNSYLSSSRTSIVTIQVNAPNVNSIQINNRNPEASTFYIHSQLSVLLLGNGLSTSGSAATVIKISESCAQDNATVTGGTESAVACTFDDTAATIEFVIQTSTNAAQLCVQTAQSEYVLTPYLDSYVCHPDVCGAPSCVPGNYLFESLQCDKACCEQTCSADPYCKYYTWYEIPGRVYRRCQTSVSCFYYSPPSSSITIPHVVQKTRILRNSWVGIGPQFAVLGPQVRAVTPQARPPPISGTTFNINIEGNGMGTEYMQIHAKLVGQETLGGNCNNLTALSEVLGQFEELERQRDEVLRQIAEFSTRNLNGTCAGGKKNCEGGPAPAGTSCSADVDCWGPSGPSGGGICGTPNSGTSCLWNYQCTFSGFCNNSLGYLTMTPPPVVPLVRVKYQELGDQIALPGGYGRFVQPTNLTFASVLFNVGTSAEAVLCIANRDPTKEESYIQEGNIIDSQLIRNMYGYAAVATFSIYEPQVTEVFPDHIFSFAPTVFAFGGNGFTYADQVKLVSSSVDCNSPGIDIEQTGTDGSVPGGSPRSFEQINSLHTNASVTFTVTQPLISLQGPQKLHICYKSSGTGTVGQYQRVGNITVVNKPPIINSYFPKEIFSFQATDFDIVGTGLGGSQKVKLLNFGFRCEGHNLDEAVSDTYALAVGSVPSIMRLNRSKEFSSLQNSAFADDLFVSRMSATFNIQMWVEQVENLTLCIKYSDLWDGLLGAGYHAVGPIVWRHPVVSDVITKVIHSAAKSTVMLSGAGLETSISSIVKLVEAFATCDQTDTYVVAGGEMTTASGNSSIRSAYFLIPTGVQTLAAVCHAFDLRNNGQALSWRRVGSLKIENAVVLSATVFSPVVSTNNQVDSNATTFMVIGEPFKVSITLSSTQPDNSFVKIVPAGAACGGQDLYTDAFDGGHGQLLDQSGISIFWNGVTIPSGFDGPLQAKLCLFLGGSSGYAESLLNVVWDVVRPFVLDVYPTTIIAGSATMLTLEGRGIATDQIFSFIKINTDPECSDNSNEIQLSSLDGGAGFAAVAIIEISPAGGAQNSVSLCWRANGDTDAKRIAVLSIANAPVLISISPTRWVSGNVTSYKLTGLGLNNQIFVNFVADSLLCGGIASKNGCQIGSCSSNVTGTCGALNYAEDSGIFAVSNPITLNYLGVMKVCFAYSAGQEFLDSGLKIEVEIWTPIRLVDYDNNGPSGFVDTQSKSDTQRVEARMTTEIPPCQRFWRSKYMFYSQLDSLDLDTPYIYDISSPFKCWSSCNYVPTGYPSTGLCPPGIDDSLVAVVRNLTISFVLSGGLRIGDTVYVASSACADDFTNVFFEDHQTFASGGEPVIVNESMKVDITKISCDRTLSDLTTQIMGPDSRAFGFKVNFALRKVTEPGRFHQLCVIKNQYSSSISVPGVYIKVTPPRLLSVEPATVWANRWITFRLKGEGFSVADKIRIIDGEAPLSCYHNGSDANIFQSSEFELPENTTLQSAEVTLKFNVPSTHVRFCYMFLGSDRWEEMTPLLSLRTSGYVYGYESTMHFLYGESIHFQNDSNQVGGLNQTVSLTPPSATKVYERSVTARALQFNLTLEGFGLTEKVKIAVTPFNVNCGGTNAVRQNLIQDTASLWTPLRTVGGGETRFPSIFVNDGQSGYQSLSQCSGTNQLNSCSVHTDSQIVVEYRSFDLRSIGRARVCYLYEYGPEFLEVGEIDIFRPCVTEISPDQGVILNKPFQFMVSGTNLASSDLLKVVDGQSCYSKISSRPYFLFMQVIDYPFNTSAYVIFTLTGPGDQTTGQRKVCYSYDGGNSFVDTGLTIQVRSPETFAALPTTLAMSAERKITFFGDAMTQGDRIVLIFPNISCESSWDATDVLYGGDVQYLDVPVDLPLDIGNVQWPAPATNSSAVFLLPREDSGIFCYWHRDGAGWATVKDKSGSPILLTVVNTYDLAMGIPNSGTTLEVSVFATFFAGIIKLMLALKS